MSLLFIFVLSVTSGIMNDKGDDDAPGIRSTANDQCEQYLCVGYFTHSFILNAVDSSVLPDGLKCVT